MRIHWAAVMFAVIGTILLTWHFRTRHLNFMIPKGVTLEKEDDGSDLAAGPILLQPNIEDTPEGAEVLGNPEDLEETIIAEITDEDLGDLDASPGLAAYQEFGKANTPDRLFELSSTLRARGQFQRALLAFERVIDSSNADSSVMSEAAKGINTLSPTLPLWNIDPTSEIALMLHLGTIRPANDQIKNAILEVATLIRKSSGEQLEITPQITSSGNTDTLGDSPIALWFSTSGTDPVTSSVITLKTSDETEAVIDEIALSVFQAVRSHLTKLGYPSPPPLQVTGRELISTYVTRLMWRDFARSLYEQKESSQAEGNTDAN